MDNVGIRTFEIAFSKDVMVPPGAVRVWGVSEGEIGFASREYDPTSRLLTVELDRSVHADILTVVVDYTIASRGDRVALDGETDTPTSIRIPSGDGVPGGRAVVRYEILQGDANRDGVVNIDDANLIVASLGSSAGDASYNPLADLNADGVVNALDLTIWSGGNGLSLPQIGDNPPVITEITPDPGGFIDSELSEIVLTYSEQLDPAYVDARDLYLSTPGGRIHPACSVAFSPDGSQLIFTFNPPLPQCGRYTLNISPSIVDITGGLAVQPAQRPVISGLSPTPPPSFDAHPSATNQASISIAGTALDAVSVEVTGPGGQATATVADGLFTIEAPLKANAINNLFFTAISSCGTRSAPAVTQIIMDAQPPNLFIDFPADGAQIQSDRTDVAGRVSDLHSGFDGMTVLINGVPADVDIGIGTNGTFFLPSFELNSSGPTVIEAVATDSLGNTRTRSITVSRAQIPPDAPRFELISGSGQSAPVHQYLDEPVAVRITRADGSPIAGKVVTFTVTRSDGILAGASGSPGGLTYQALTDSTGVAEAWWRMGGDSGCGNNRIEVTSRDIAGTVMLCATATPGPASQINVGTGNSQRGETGTQLALPLRVFVNDACNGIADLPVEFTVVQGDGVFPNGQSSMTVNTAATGHAQVNFILGQTPGVNRVRATFQGNPNGPAEFVLTGLARDPDRMTSFTGLVLDNASQPVEGAEVRLVIGGVEIGTTTSDIEGQFGFYGFEASGMTDLYVDGAVATGVGGPKNYQPVDPFSYPSLHYETVVVANAANSLGTPVLLPRMNPNNVRFYSTTEQTILECEGVEGLRMIIEPGSMTMPDGTPAQNGQIMALNQVHHDDIPMPMPDGAAPPFAWTVYPPEATFDPPIRVEYPNMSGLAPGAVAYFLTFDHATGKFEIFSSGTVTPDGSTIVTDPGSGLTLSGWGCNCPPYSVTGECCIMECSDRGEITGGQISTSVVGTQITATITGASDSGGTRSCDTGKTEPVPPASLMYRYEIIDPAGRALATGSGSSVQVQADLCGNYEVRFTATARRSCAPASRTYSATVLFGDEPVQTGSASKSLSIDYEGISLFLVDLPGVRASYTSSGTIFETCCGGPGIGLNRGNDRAEIEEGSVTISGSTLQSFSVPIPLAGPLVRVIDRVICGAVASRLPDFLFDCEVGIDLKADGITLGANGQYRATDCPAPDWNITELSGVLQFENPRIEIGASITILGNTFALSGAGTSTVRGDISSDGTNLLLRLTDSGGRFIVAGELPGVGDFELLSTEYPPFINLAFSFPLPSPSDLARSEGEFRGGVFQSQGKPLPMEDWPDEWLPKPPEVDQRWELMVAGQMVAGSDEAFRISNIAAPDLFGPGGPGTVPDFLSDDFLRVTGSAEIDGRTWYAFSEPFQITQSETFLLGDLTITDIPPPLPESIALGLADGFSPVIEVGQQVQMETIATLGDGSTLDVTPRTAWTTYRTSNPAVATVDQDGLVTAHARGPAIITAVNESATATLRVLGSAQAVSTTLAGVAVLEDGTPAVGAEVTLLVHGGSATVDANGRFTISATVPVETNNLTVTATLTQGKQQLIATISGLSPVSEGFTDVGVLTLRELCDLRWSDQVFCIPGLRGDVKAAISWDDGTGEALYVGGSFNIAGCANAVGIARWDGSSWSPVGGDLLGISGLGVNALVIFDDGTGPALYAGGSFEQAGGILARNIARWNGSSWAPLVGGGRNGVVRAMTVFDDGAGPALYVGGGFSERISRWNGSLWSSLGGGVNGTVETLTVFEDKAGVALYAGGSFTQAGGSPANHVARWDGSTWTPLNEGVSSWVRALAVFDDGSGQALYAGGIFQQAGGIPASRIARWDGTSWSPVGSGVSGFGSSSGSSVSALTVFDDGSGPSLYVGGRFENAGGSPARFIAAWDGSSWNALGDQISDTVTSLAVFDDGSGPALYAGGSFTAPGSRIAKWDGGSWSELADPAGTSVDGLVTRVNALTPFDDGSGPALYVGGQFSVAGGSPVNNIARWDGSGWSPLGSGLRGIVRAMTVFDDGSGPALYAAGDFTRPGGPNYIARWDGSSWSSLGSGVSGGGVDALVVFDDGSGPALYAGGTFTSPANRIARWDGSTWSPLGSGVASARTVHALAVFDDGTGQALYAGGSFSQIGGISASRIARWDGASWSALGGGVSGTVRALAVFDDGLGSALYAGGEFSGAGGNTANRIARWDGVAWSPLGSGVINGLVESLAVFDDGTGSALYAGGSFSEAGGSPSNRIARWDGKLWSPLDSGIGQFSVHALTVFEDSKSPALFAGGSFTEAGSAVSAYIAKWSRDCASRSNHLSTDDDRPSLVSRSTTAYRPNRPSDATRPSPTTALMAPAVRLSGTGSHHGSIARASARVLDAGEAAALLKHLSDPLANPAGQRLENRPGEDGLLRAFLIEPDGVEIALPTLGGPGVRGEALNHTGDVVGLSTTADGRIEGFVWYYDAGPIVSIGTLGGPGSAALLWHGPAVALGDADDASRTQRAVLWVPDHELLDLNALLEPGSGLTLTLPRATLPDGSILVEAIDDDGHTHFLSLRLELYEALPADLNRDGIVDLSDLSMLLRMIELGDLAGDLNADGHLDWLDIAFLTRSMGQTADAVGMFNGDGD